MTEQTTTNIDRLAAKHTPRLYHLPRFEVRDVELFFGYHDGDKSVVEIQAQATARGLRRKRSGPSQGFVLRGRLLDLVCAAVLYMTDHNITPGLRELGLRVRVNGPDTFSWIEAEHEGVRVSVEKSERRKGLRLWVDSGPVWQNYDLTQQQTDTLVDRLCEAAQWPIHLAADA